MGGRDAGACGGGPSVSDRGEECVDERDGAPDVGADVGPGGAAFAFAFALEEEAWERPPVSSDVSASAAFSAGLRLSSVSEIRLRGSLRRSSRAASVSSSCLAPPRPLIDTVRRKPLAASVRTVRVTGRGQVPSTGVDAVLVQVTVTGPGQAGAVRAYTKAADPPVARFDATGSASGVSLVRLRGGSTIELRSSVPGTPVAVNVLGYLTTPASH